MESDAKFGPRSGAAVAAAIVMAMIGAPAMAQDATPAAAPAAAPADASAQPVPASAVFSQEELKKLLAPIALYPDALLAQMLPASAYPVQLVQAQRWLDRNKELVAKGDFSGVDNQNWDPAVISLTRFPSVVKKMSEDLDWTTDLGDAVVNQPEDVANVIQDLRLQAQKAGSLKTTTQQVVKTVPQDDRQVIVIQPADPAVVYVPTYDPGVAFYTGAPLIGFGVGVAVGAIWNNNYWNWRTGAIYPPIWPGYPAWRPPYAGWRPGDPTWRPGGGNNINVGGGNNINIGGGGGNNINIGNNVRPWRPTPDYRPGAGSKPDIGANRPGAGNRPGGGATRPGVGEGANRPNLPGGGTRPNLPGGGAGNVPGGANRPNLGGGATTLPGGANRPNLGGGAGGANRPGGGATTLPGGANRPNLGGGAGGANRPGGGATTLPGGANRPNLGGGAGGANRPAPGNVNRPAPGGGANRPSMPATRPAPRPGGGPNGSAISGIGQGAGNNNFANRGAASRASMPRPSPGGGGGRPGGGAAAMPRGGGGGGRRSDIRLKHDLVLLGRLDDGLGYYRFVYNGGRTAFVGVMAQEVQAVMPAAVMRGPDGYLRVSYERLGVPFETYETWLSEGARLPHVAPAPLSTPHSEDSL